jgi:hypothetical protein
LRRRHCRHHRRSKQRHGVPIRRLRRHSTTAGEPCSGCSRSAAFHNNLRVAAQRAWRCFDAPPKQNACLSVTLPSTRSHGDCVDAFLVARGPTAGAWAFSVVRGQVTTSAPRQKKGGGFQLSLSSSSLPQHSSD